MSRRRAWGSFAALCVITPIVNFPIIMMLLNSVQTTQQIIASSDLLPHHPTLANFIFLSGRTPFWTFFGNSAVVSSGGTALGVVAATLAGYAMSRWRSQALDVYGNLLLLVQMFPIIVALIPLFILFRQIGLINNPLSVILIHAVVHLPFATWMAKAFFDTIPRELEEAAQVDGCSKLQGFVRIVLPLSGPGLAAVVIFSFLFSYNEFFVSSVFLRDTDVMTIPVGVQMFMQQYATDWGALMAAATLTMIPAFIFFMFVQKYITYGAVAAGVKG